MLGEPAPDGVEPEAYLREVLARIGEYSINRLQISSPGTLPLEEPEVYLCAVLACIGEYAINRIDDLLPWNIARRDERSLAA